MPHWQQQEQNDFDHKKLIGEHKIEIKAYQAYLIMYIALRDKIIEAIKNEWLAPLKDEEIGFIEISQRD